MTTTTRKRLMASTVAVLASAAATLLITPTASAATVGPEHHTVKLEITGSGSTYSVNYTPPTPDGQQAVFNAPLPFSTGSITVHGHPFVEIAATTKDQNSHGCKITVDRKVVVDQANTTFCTWQIVQENDLGRPVPKRQF